MGGYRDRKKYPLEKLEANVRHFRSTLRELERNLRNPPSILIWLGIRQKVFRQTLEEVHAQYTRSLRDTREEIRRRHRLEQERLAAQPQETNTT